MPLSLSGLLGKWEWGGGCRIWRIIKLDFLYFARFNLKRFLLFRNLEVDSVYEGEEGEHVEEQEDLAVYWRHSKTGDQHFLEFFFFLHFAEFDFKDFVCLEISNLIQYMKEKETCRVRPKRARLCIEDTESWRSTILGNFLFSSFHWIRLQRFCLL